MRIKRIAITNPILEEISHALTSKGLGEPIKINKFENRHVSRELSDNSNLGVIKSATKGSKHVNSIGTPCRNKFRQCIKMVY